MKIYLDASVVLRHLLGEPDPLAIPKDAELGSSELTIAECHRVLDRYRLLRALDGDVLHARQAAVGRVLDSTLLLAVSGHVLNRASYPLPVPLATLDALHLSTALVWQESTPEPVSFATHDLALARAARGMHLDVVGV